MERIKSLCNFILCTSMLVFLTTYSNAIYPQGIEKGVAYIELIDQYDKIIKESSLTIDDLTTLIKESEFEVGIDRNTVKDRVYQEIAKSEIYQVLFDEAQMQEVSEQFALLYEQQSLRNDNVKYHDSMQLIQLFCGIFTLLSVTTLWLIKKRFPIMQCIKKIQHKRAKSNTNQTKQ